MRLPQFQHRKCGRCQQCCVTFNVRELEKPAGTPCKHLCESGCGLYGKPRPKVCGTYRCHWLGGAFLEEDRPDRIGVIFTVKTSEELGVNFLIADEFITGAFETPRVVSLIENESRTWLVMLKHIDGKRTILGPPAIRAKAMGLVERMLAEKVSSGKSSPPPS